MTSENILLAIEEKRKWEARLSAVTAELEELRQRRIGILKEMMTLQVEGLVDDLKKIEIEITERKKEESRINENINYYSSLISDMKQEMNPSSLAELLRSI